MTYLLTDDEAAKVREFCKEFVFQSKERGTEALAILDNAKTKPFFNAEEYLRHKYGAYRGFPAWREIEEGYNQGRYDEAMAQGPSPYPDEAKQTLQWCEQCGEGVTDFCRSKVEVKCGYGFKQLPKQDPLQALTDMTQEMGLYEEPQQECEHNYLVSASYGGKLCSKCGKPEKYK